MDNINSHINVKFYYLLNETTPGSVAITVLELYAKIFLKILKNWENIAILELILTTLLNTCIISIVILIYFFFSKNYRAKPGTFR